MNSNTHKIKRIYNILLRNYNINKSDNNTNFAYRNKSKINYNEKNTLNNQRSCFWINVYTVTIVCKYSFIRSISTLKRGGAKRSCDTSSMNSYLFGINQPLKINSSVV